MKYKMMMMIQAPRKYPSFALSSSLSFFLCCWFTGLVAAITVVMIISENNVMSLTIRTTDRKYTQQQSQYRRSILVPWLHDQDKSLPPPILGWTIEERRKPSVLVLEGVIDDESTIVTSSSPALDQSIIGKPLTVENNQFPGLYRVTTAWHRQEGSSALLDDTQWASSRNKSASPISSLPSSAIDASQCTSTVVTVDLCYVEKESSLASSLWPASLAGSILSCCPVLQQFIQNKTIMEMGCGLGLMGQTIMAKPTTTSEDNSNNSNNQNDDDNKGPASCLLTDYDVDVLTLVQDQLDNLASHNNTLNKNNYKNINTLPLDWRSLYEPSTASPSSLQSNLLPQDGVDMIIGTDVAYYHHLIRPLMDTTQKYLAKEDDHRSTMCLFIGQANRACQWELYHQLQQGGYNPYTDKRTDPWPGQTRMLLYHLYTTDWVMDNQEGNSQIDWDKVPMEGILPMAVLMHLSPGLHLSPLSPYDFLATPEVEAGLSMSF